MPNEEFDIMKPISADLDIGTTMFDVPEESSSEPDVFSSPVSAQLDIGTSMFDSTATEPVSDAHSDTPFSHSVSISDKETILSTTVSKTEPVDTLPVFSPPDPHPKKNTFCNGVSNLDYGFMTADEAALFGQEENAAESVHVIDRPTPATEASAVRPPEELATPENSLERALEELQELQSETVQQTTVSSDDQLMQMALEAEYLEEKQLAEEEWFPNSTVRVMGKVVRGKKKNIATLVILIVFAFVFMLLPFILAYLL